MTWKPTETLRERSMRIAQQHGASAAEGELLWAMLEWVERRDAPMTDARWRTLGLDPQKMRDRQVDRVFWLGEMYNALIARSRNPAAVSAFIQEEGTYLA